MNVACQAQVSKASRDVFPSMRENRGMSVLVCLFCYIFLNIELGRIDGILLVLFI